MIRKRLDLGYLKIMFASCSVRCSGAISVLSEENKKQVDANLKDLEKEQNREPNREPQVQEGFQAEHQAHVVDVELSESNT